MSPHVCWSSQRGATAVVVAVVIAVLVGMLSLALNIGHQLSFRGEMQNAVDSSALAGAIALDGTSAGITAATTTATNFALAHVTDSNPGEPVPAGLIEFGIWHRATRAFQLVTGRDAASAAQINSVRVRSTMQSKVWMPSFLGAGPQAAVGAQAIAVSGGVSEIECGDMPFVIRQGCVADACPRSRNDPEYSGGYYYVALSSDTVDTGGLTNLLPGPGVNTPAVCGILNDPQYCEKNRPNDPLGQGDSIYMGNGAPWGAQCGNGSICGILQRRVGEEAMLPIVQYDGEPATQCDGKYNQAATIAGFATVKIVLVRCSKNGVTKSDLSLTQAQVTQMLANCAADKQQQVCLVLELRCNVKDSKDNTPGGNWYGTGTVYPRLTR